MPFVDDVNRDLRDFEGYTGDGQGGVGDLPVGDRSTSTKKIEKRALRQLFIQLAQTMGDPSALQVILDDLSIVQTGLSGVGSQVDLIQAQTIIRQTDAFVRLVTDQAGNVLLLEKNDGSIMGANGIMPNARNERETTAFQALTTDQEGNILSIIGASGQRLAAARGEVEDAGKYLRNTDAFSYLKTTADGSILELDSGSPSRPVDIGLGEFNLLLVYGQSPFLGSDTTAISTTLAAGLKMFNAGSLLTSAEWNDPASFASLVDHVTEGQEDGSRGAAEGLQAAFAAAGKDPGDIVTITACQGGRTAAELSEGGEFYSRLETAIDALADIADAGNMVPGIVPVVFWQGEADIALFTSPTVWRRQIENGIRRPLQAKVDEVFGEGHSVVMVMMQPASAFYYNRTHMTLASEIVRLCNDDPNYVYGGTTYQYDYGAGGTGSHLLTGGDVKRAAFSGGYAAGQVAAGVPVGKIDMVRAQRVADRVIQIEYTAPTLPLVLDDVAIANPGDCGFEVQRMDTGANLGIASVTVSRNRFVKIVTDSDIPSVELRIKYAWIGGQVDDADADVFGSFAGPDTGQRGCLRDSTTRTVDVSGSAVAVPHFAPITEINVE